MSTISLTYNGDEILQDVIITSAQFEAEANGTAGLCRFSVKDDGHTYQPGYFKAGGVLNLTVDGQLVWAGAVMSVGRQYAFPVDDTTQPDDTPRFWDIQGADWNILFSKRFVWNQSNPTDKLPIYPAETPDSEVVIDLMTNFMDLSGDGIGTDGVQTIGPIGVFGQDFRVGDTSETWGAAMNLIIANNGGIFYIDPDKVLQYRDVETPTAPFVLSDQPTGTDAGYREMLISSGAQQMINDAMVWGAGMGSDQMVFSRTIDTESGDAYGTFQFADLLTDVWIQTDAERRSESLVYGSPTSHRGHNQPQIEVRCVSYKPGLRVGMVVPFESNIFDESFIDSVVIDNPGTTVDANIENFAARIKHIESNGNYTDQNRSSGAYGAYQIMPGNWRVWACDILGYPRTVGVASKWTDGATWNPPTTPANQDAVALYKFSHAFNWLGDWRRVAAMWRSGGSVAVLQPAYWSRGTLLYVNHACMPLGFPETTNATVLPAVGGNADVSTNADVQAGLGFIDNRTSSYVAPIRRMVITFPTPTDARFEYLISQIYDQGWMGATPYPTSTPPTGDDRFFTELVPFPGSDLGTGDSYQAYVDKTYGNYTQYFIRWGSAGSSAGYAAFSAIYSTVGVENGFVDSIPWYNTTCGLGYGGFGGNESAEMWFNMGPVPSEINGVAVTYELKWLGATESGVADSYDVSFQVHEQGWTPSVGDRVSRDPGGAGGGF